MSKNHLPPTLRFLLAARRCELQGLEALAQACELVVLVARLVHALQKERGYSNFYLCSDGDRLLAALETLQGEAAGVERELLGFLDGLAPEAAHAADRARLLNGIAHALYRIDELPGLRRRVRERGLQVEEVLGAYTQLIGSLLAVAFEAADSSLDPEVTRLLVALLNFMQGKELSGQERACGVLGYEAGYFPEDRKERMRSLLDNQRRCFDVFVRYAPPEHLAAWEAAAGKDEPVQRMRDMLQRTSDDQRVDAGLAELWFQLCTDRIDAMHEVERLLADALAQRCRRRIEETREELSNHRLLLERLADQASGRVPAVLFDVRGRVLDAPPQDGVGSGMARSLLDMMREQTLRMQHADEALAAARAALDERKRIERAKWLLVSRYRLSEQAAHDRLLRAAMDGGLPLGEVARQVLEKLGKGEGK